MTDETTSLRNLLAAWERKAKKAEEMLIHLRAALAIEEESQGPVAPQNGQPSVAPAPAPSSPEPEPMKRGPAKPFAPKYGKTAGDRILELLEGGKGLSLRQIQDSLTAQGFEYSDQAVNHALKRLQSNNLVRKKPAPANSTATFVFKRIEEAGDSDEGGQGRLLP